jgi:hypothetical protein
MPTKWLQQRANGAKKEPGIGFEGPGVEHELVSPRAVAWSFPRERDNRLRAFGDRQGLVTSCLAISARTLCPASGMESARPPEQRYEG